MNFEKKSDSRAYTAKQDAQLSPMNKNFSHFS
jgi:hypothetical protein